MRKLIVSLHISLEGYAAGPNGEMDWIHVDEDIFDLVGSFTDKADTALYGRITYEMMDSYWPTAADRPGAGKHDREHSAWYTTVRKLVVSRFMKDEQRPLTSFISTNIAGEILNIKRQAGSTILLFGSPSVVRLLIESKLVDEYWMFVNPVILGKGIPIFPLMAEKIALTLKSCHPFKSGVTALHYQSE